MAQEVGHIKKATTQEASIMETEIEVEARVSKQVEMGLATLAIEITATCAINTRDEVPRKVVIGQGEKEEGLSRGTEVLKVIVLTKAP